MSPSKGTTNTHGLHTELSEPADCKEFVQVEDAGKETAETKKPPKKDDSKQDLDLDIVCNQEKEYVLDKSESHKFRQGVEKETSEQNKATGNTNNEYGSPTFFEKRPKGNQMEDTLEESESNIEMNDTIRRLLSNETDVLQCGSQDKVCASSKITDTRENNESGNKNDRGDAINIGIHLAINKNPVTTNTTANENEKCILAPKTQVSNTKTPLPITEDNTMECTTMVTSASEKQTDDVKHENQEDCPTKSIEEPMKSTEGAINEKSAKTLDERRDDKNDPESKTERACESVQNERENVKQKIVENKNRCASLSDALRDNGERSVGEQAGPSLNALDKVENEPSLTLTAAEKATPRPCCQEDEPMIAEGKFSNFEY